MSSILLSSSSLSPARSLRILNTISNSASPSNLSFSTHTLSSWSAAATFEAPSFRRPANVEGFNGTKKLSQFFETLKTKGLSSNLLRGQNFYTSSQWLDFIEEIQAHEITPSSEICNVALESLASECRLDSMNECCSRWQNFFVPNAWTYASFIQCTLNIENRKIISFSDANFLTDVLTHYATMRRRRIRPTMKVFAILEEILFLLDRNTKNVSGIAVPYIPPLEKSAMLSIVVEDMPKFAYSATKETTYEFALASLIETNQIRYVREVLRTAKIQGLQFSSFIAKNIETLGSSDQIPSMMQLFIEGSEVYKTLPAPTYKYMISLLDTTNDFKNMELVLSKVRAHQIVLDDAETIAIAVKHYRRHLQMLSADRKLDNVCRSEIARLGGNTEDLQSNIVEPAAPKPTPSKFSLGHTLQKLISEEPMTAPVPEAPKIRGQQLSSLDLKMQDWRRMKTLPSTKEVKWHICDLLRECAATERGEEIDELAADAIKYNVETLPPVVEALVLAYVKTKRLENALAVLETFRNEREKNTAVLLWTKEIVRSFCEIGAEGIPDVENARQLFYEVDKRIRIMRYNTRLPFTSEDERNFESLRAVLSKYFKTEKRGSGVKGQRSKK